MNHAISADRPRLLVLDASYTLEAIMGQGMESSVTCRDLDGFFDHVWSVHPFASMLTSPGWTPRFGRANWTELAPRHTFVEGKAGRWGWLARLGLLNFAVGQLGLLWRLRRLVKQERIAVIRVGDPLYVGLFGLALARLTGRSLMIRVNGNNDKVRANTGAPIYPRLFRTARVERAIERFVFPRADMVAAPNPDNLEFARAAGAREGRTTIFRYGNLLAPEHRQEPSERGRDNALFARIGVYPGRFLLSVGRLQPLKFPEDCVYVLAELRKRGHDIKLLFAGEGELEPALRAQAAALGVTEHVVFGGNQTQAALAQLNAHAGAVLSPFTGRALAESGLGGAGIVAYDLDWQGELIEDGVTGYLIPFREKQAFVDATERLLTDPQLARTLGSAVRQRALEMLDPELLNEHERGEYRRILGIG
jgi:glycosyltransferase involved in cell wall biosynthesis